MQFFFTKLQRIIATQNMKECSAEWHYRLSKNARPSACVMRAGNTVCAVWIDAVL